MHRFFSRKLAVAGLVIVIVMILFAAFGSNICQFTFVETNTADRYHFCHSGCDIRTDCASELSEDGSDAHA